MAPMGSRSIAQIGCTSRACLGATSPSWIRIAVRYSIGLDYGYRAVHQVVVLGKKIIQAYYKRAPKFSYFDGCSNGGRQALMEAEKCPKDFNVIAAGAPALDWTGFMIGANWDMQALQATETSNLIPFEKFQVIGDAVLGECDAIDGLADGLIHFRRLLVTTAVEALTKPQILRVSLPKRERKEEQNEIDNASKSKCGGSESNPGRTCDFA